jgi:subtilisin-like proprotein convertase family protein
VVEKDRVDAKSAIGKVDSNRDGVMSREELRNSKYKKYEQKRFRYDDDSDHQLTAAELANYYARIRVDKEAKTRNQALAKKRAAPESPAKLSHFALSISSLSIGEQDYQVSDILELAVNGNDWTDLIIADGSSSSTKPITIRKGMWISATNGGSSLLSIQVGSTAALEVIGRYDKNGNGVLEHYEWQRIAGQIGWADADRNDSITRQELDDWLGRVAVSQASSSSPDWFTQRDSNHDGQVMMSEYAAEWTNALLSEFNRYDGNRDGIITTSESLSPIAMQGREFVSGRAVVIEPGVGTSSTIQVSEDFEIADINVRLSISHRGPSQLDAFMVSPSGRRVDLFAGAGKNWKGSHFDNTLFDDQAKQSITAASPPFRGSLRPERADSEDQSGLSSFHGERSRGLWRLYVTADRSNRAGLLNSWSLVLEPEH